MTAGARVLTTTVGSAQATLIGAGGNLFQGKDSSGFLRGSSADHSLRPNDRIDPAIPVATPPMATPVLGKHKFDTASFEPQVRALAPLALIGLGGIVLTPLRGRSRRHS
ncbi:hypothetical protein [uncultured Thiohalocapsa sp.]|uniref:hypothetical protein n=1 Tax=uncultured Thiohalocapsa sp. TaxID=768990 RepID=UPI0025D8C604|nr:hypothetical protein [uncultured Thiohalocapsa sp.]